MVNVNTFSFFFPLLTCVCCGRSGGAGTGMSRYFSLASLALARFCSSCSEVLACAIVSYDRLKTSAAGNTRWREEGEDGGWGQEGSTTCTLWALGLLPSSHKGLLYIPIPSNVKHYLDFSLWHEKIEQRVSVPWCYSVTRYQKNNVPPKVQYKYKYKEHFLFAFFSRLLQTWRQSTKYKDTNNFFVVFAWQRSEGKLQVERHETFLFVVFCVSGEWWAFWNNDFGTLNKLRKQAHNDLEAAKERKYMYFESKSLWEKVLELDGKRTKRKSAYDEERKSA